MRTLQQRHQRELLIDRIRTATDQMIALELDPGSSPHLLQQVRDRRERLLEEYGEQARRLARLYGTRAA